MQQLEVMGPHLARQAATGRSGVAAIGVAQEFQRVWTAYEGKTSTGTPRWSFVKTDRRVTCYYFYLWDEDFGPAFLKVCAWFPYPAKIWLNGHEWAKRQAARDGVGFTALSNGFAACDDPAALQAQSMTATVVVAQLRSTVIDLLQLTGTSAAQAKALLPG